jgi:D-alanine-D-alanine ligase
MKKLRVLVLVHANFVPPEDVSKLSDAEQYELKTELDVVQALETLGHRARAVGRIPR